MSDNVIDNIKQALPDNTSHTCRFEIRSETSDRLYVVARSRRTGKWECSCPGWVHHRHCKHLAAMKDFLQYAEKEVKELEQERKQLAGA